MTASSAALWVFLLFTFHQLNTGGCQLGLPGNQTPRVLRVDRNWNVLAWMPPGSLVTYATVDRNDDHELVFLLEKRMPDDPPLPFTIDNATGVIYTNDTLKDLVGKPLYLYVKVDDPSSPISLKTEVRVRVLNDTSSAGGASDLPRYPPGLLQPHYLPAPPTLLQRPGAGGGSAPGPGPGTGAGVGVGLAFSRRPPTATPNYRTTNATTSTTTSTPAPPEPSPPPPSSLPPDLNPGGTGSGDVSGSSNSSTTASAATPHPVPRGSSAAATAPVSTQVPPGSAAPPSDIATTLVPVTSVLALFVFAGAAYVLRKRYCAPRPKGKDDMRKEVSVSGAPLEEPMALGHWRGPRAHSNRYEGREGEEPHPTTQLSNAKPADRWEFPRHRLKVFNILGEGCFGQVWRCEALDIDGREGPTVVAVKTLKENATEKERADLVQELQVMKMLEPHPNVVRLLGCCTEKDPLFVIMEYVALGKLQSFLRSSRAERHYGNLHGPSKALTSRDLTSFVYQVARGMEFLSFKGIIHRDLAARNVLIGEDHVCKVADFGFARDIMSSHVYERKSEGRLPIRWMAPESLYDNIFSVKSDVWSFGVLIWEVVTLGSTPYPGMAAAEVMRRVRDGYRLDRPEHCRRELYNIMYYCWDRNPKERPGFGELVAMLEPLLLAETDYIELERFPDHSYYNMVSLSDEKL
ncbi:tyrosine kinase receptor Cad96Ca [Schistocerca gregaria]|uniref:tyrosine kinase receptor Cad96Ca n=1 Tax=Schistocerca gregaria TaxID=7010 RepID=UPI00211E7600|nr:tyrosine kinase receptor Cad96Ca [Schistocerca gregaria]XP_049834663.1 tyrosine kinase receptor Cad96Ca [Schistocerca gregaria]